MSGEAPAPSPVQPVQMPAQTPIPTETQDDLPEGAGLPFWLPLLVAVLAVGVAFFVATRICPTLSALVSPPEPVLPVGAMLESRESKGTQDQWLYKVSASACEVAKFYETAWGTCILDPSSGCSGTAPTLPNQPFTIGRCFGDQQIAAFRVSWWASILRNGDAQGSTIFRIYREVN